ncbi:MAG: MMPL family transporter [Pseudomonadota bacterium]
MNNFEVKSLIEFDRKSGSMMERLLFNHRLLILLACAIVTATLGWQTASLRFNTSFEKTVPASHPYILNFLKYRTELTGLGNAVRISVENVDGTIDDGAYLATLQKINDEVFLLPGVERRYMKSLWTPDTRWNAVTEEGLEGGPVIPPRYDGSPAANQQFKANLARSGEIGQLAARNGKSSVIYLPLMAKDASGAALDYGALSDALEDLRRRYESPRLKLHITGFAKVAGDLIAGLRVVLMFFALAVAIGAAVLYWYSRCIRSTLLVVASSLVAVTWELGLLPALGYQLDPYLILVPFLVFAIGMSHGAQKMNGIMQDIGRGTHQLIAARYTFRRLFLAGLTALLADAVGFAVLMLIDIQVIRELAVTASIGVAALIFTNLILLPILLSYTGVGRQAARRSLAAERSGAAGGGAHAASGIWRFLLRFTRRRWAQGALLAAVLLTLAGLDAARGLKIGDLDPGAPELRSASRYNRDAAFMTANYGASSDVFAIMVKTPPQQCASYGTLMAVDALDGALRQLDGVESTSTMASLNRRMLAGMNEGNPKWHDLPRSQDMLNTITANAPRGLYNETCSLLTMYVYLKDHKADTLARVVAKVESFAAANDSADVQFLLAAGSAGIEAATNIVVKQAWREMLLLVYLAVALLCFITFRSWRAVVVAVLPLVVTSVLAEALMVALGMGVKVATLPVIALGVGIGVDYALYVLSILLDQMRAGQSLAEAYRRALQFTGKVVMLTGITLALGVVTWAFSPIKFQADMGILLAFMFIWNMVGALVLLPALAYYLLPQAAFNRSKTKESSTCRHSPKTAC